ncbi:P-loop containing nucleoside triphosphate hydrolase protein [Westerdykella ornata]|uniref:ATP-dependent RNA helicase n=1 Tax=Westerdykella ornata TaxID=318751 RepID=A0A6A6JDC7_WESOR|nr:P-loop containing nucleoside triphosphate hydrolase protein [Westerdykella ornata]KAF2274620.1 P-loop containing nucleoside triphosphate hydrolase protein [Westerdykella ornata]
MPGPLYARWVPPAKPKAQEKSESLPHPPGKTSQPTIESPEPLRQKEKSKRKSTDQPAPSPELKEDERDAAASGHTQEEQESGEKPKKLKKRKRELDVNDEIQVEEEATPKKHKAILSKFERSYQRAEAIRASGEQHYPETSKEDEPAPELHVPLPQPAPVADIPYQPTFSALPSWLATPTTIESSQTVSFEKLGIHPSFLKKLEKQGFRDALAVQSVLLPMLRPGYDQHLGDICVSARTGSGKTLAYLLPIIETLRDQAVTTLSAIIVVPTRQLVDQALKVAEELCEGTKLKVGTALGSVPFASEQKQLVKVRARYDPQRAKELHDKASRQMKSALGGRGGIFDDLAKVPKDHVPQYDSGVDILICTPGRLVEHIESTTGFLLRSVRWLVIDEADQLIAQNFQGWATALMDALHDDTPEDFMNTQERLRKQRRNLDWAPALPDRTHITKVVLSATMKKDLTKLGTLRLRRPRLVVVENDKEDQPSAPDGEVYELPSTLAEYAIPVGDGSKKPLYLLFILLRHILNLNHPMEEKTDSGSANSSSEEDSEAEPSSKADCTSALSSDRSRILVFVKSNENASRLAHLLSVLEPPLQPFVKAMTPGATTKQSQKLLRSFAAGRIKILIASDTASRGLDIPDITHVINYDMPGSIISYVHRVGRTARAGKQGQAMTLVAKNEAGWFWNQIAKGSSVKRVRGTKVVRVELKERDVTWDRKRTYQEALQQLQGAVEGNPDNTEA